MNNIKKSHSKYNVIKDLSFAFNIFLFMLWIASCTSVESRKVDNTKIKFEKKIHDFKKVSGRDTVTTIFKFYNIGEASLFIQDIKSSCGCTVPVWTKQIVKPQGNGYIQVKYFPKDPGYFIKTIRVFYNGENSPQQLAIKGYVVN